MGDALNPLMLRSFEDELQKMAQGAVFGNFGSKILSNLRNPKVLSLRGLARLGKFTRGGFRGFEEAGKRIGSPLEGLKAGWRDASPLAGMESRAKEMGYGSVMEAAKALKGTDPKKYKKLLGGGEHLLGSQPGVGRVQSAAESLSRSGWTGAGRVTKYLPVGMKSWIVAPAAMEIPGIVNAPPASRTGEGGALERGLGALGSAGGMIASTGLGIVPGMAMWYGGQQLGSRLGRVLDRVRSGASVREAVTAPTPTEAAQQLETIQRYYG